MTAGGIAFVAVACSPDPTPNPDDQIGRSAVSAMRAFLAATDKNLGKAPDYFPTVDFSTADLPSATDADQAISAGEPTPHGRDKWLVPLTVTDSSGESDGWQLELALTQADDITHYTPTGMPSRWPQATTDKARANPFQQTVDPEHSVSKAAKDFLTNWLIPGGDPGRYTVNSSAAPKWATPPFTDITVTAVRSNKPPPSQVSGTVLVQVDVLGAATYTRPASYQLQLKAVNGNWMVAAVNPEF
ncbi:hypothetical protein [Mycobacteroides salmoniphilum]|uniref:Conjugative transposon protein TcpC n=1 Tax=Mycobacteroides salmoniphilum TaxID=404941 RepID=A0A4R8T0D5_9MYCO|nr:hypothetical protein [Mycobacteroides salmoniphilum]TEA09226.1 hypothetical protein CCUG60884_00216 [Mycobacteroides salmoniphilum]